MEILNSREKYTETASSAITVKIFVSKKISARMTNREMAKTHVKPDAVGSMISSIFFVFCFS